MSEYPQSYIFTEPSQNYWLVEIDNQGNSMAPVGIPAVIKNYAKDIAATHKTCYKESVPQKMPIDLYYSTKEPPRSISQRSNQTHPV